MVKKCDAYYFCAAAIVSFVQSAYSVNEIDQMVQVELMFTNSSLTNVSIQDTSSDITATGEEIIILLLYMCMYVLFYKVHY